MDWKSEAQALVDEMSPFVKNISITETSDSQVNFEIVTLEGNFLLVAMKSDGFRIYNMDDSHVYETLNSLLDDNSNDYRKAFAQALLNKLNSLAR